MCYCLYLGKQDSSNKDQQQGTLANPENKKKKGK